MCEECATSFALSLCSVCKRKLKSSQAKTTQSKICIKCAIKMKCSGSKQSTHWKMIISTRLLLRLCVCARMRDCACLHFMQKQHLLRWEMNKHNFLFLFFLISFYLFSTLFPKDSLEVLCTCNCFFRFYFVLLDWRTKGKKFKIDNFYWDCFIAAIPLQSSSMSIDCGFSLALKLLASFTAQEVSNWSASFWQS